MSQFDELLAALQQEATEQETLAKALPAEDGADDEAIQAAAGDDADAGSEQSEDAGDGAGEGDDEGEGDESLTKSMTVDGEEFEVVDAEGLIKSLGALEERVGAQEGVLAKALETTLGLVKSQGDMIKSLSARVEKLSGQGRGRKTVLAITEKPAPGDTPLAKSQPAAMQPGEILAKALAAQSAGKITGLDVSRCEIAIQSGVALPADVMAKL